MGTQLLISSTAFFLYINFKFDIIYGLVKIIGPFLIGQLIVGNQSKFMVLKYLRAKK